jgi:hypothetical protein
MELGLHGLDCTNSVRSVCRHSILSHRYSFVEQEVSLGLKLNRTYRLEFLSTEPNAG